jgi:hypothetical protein
MVKLKIIKGVVKLEYVCMSCYRIFDNRNLKVWNEQFICPVKECLGEVIELDEMITPTIIMLNKKGYMTSYCCAGHIDKNCGYISFHYYDDMDEEMFLPKGYPEWTYRFPQEKSDVFRWKFESEDFTGERIKEIGEVHKMIYNWAAELDSICDCADCEYCTSIALKS